MQLSTKKHIFTVVSYECYLSHVHLFQSFNWIDLLWHTWHMRNLDSIGPDGNLLPEPLTCQELCVVKLFGRIRTAKKKKKKKRQWMVLLHKLGLNLHFQLGMSWLEYTWYEHYGYLLLNPTQKQTNGPSIIKCQFLIFIITIIVKLPFVACQ